MSDYRRVYIRSPYIAMAKRPSSQTFMSFFIIGVPILQVEGGERLQIKWQSIVATNSIRNFFRQSFQQGDRSRRFVGPPATSHRPEWSSVRLPSTRHCVAWVGLAGTGNSDVDQGVGQCQNLYCRELQEAVWTRPDH